MMVDAASIPFLGVDFDRYDIDEALAWIDARRADAPFAYIVTPNTDHVVRLDREAPEGPVWRAYRTAALRLCDSRIVGRLARMAGIKLRVVPGSDLTARLLSGHVHEGDRICIIGGDPEMLADLAALLPGRDFVQHIPPMGFRHDPREMRTAADFVVAARARITLLAVGFPQQELLALHVADTGQAVGTGLCIGASIEFVTGRKSRAPRLMQLLGLEWLYRLLSEPRRLWRRYLVEGPRIFAMMLERRKR